MDLTVELDGKILNVRAAGVIIHNNKVLVHRNINSDHYALIGGRVMIGENSQDTVKREVYEELGKEVEIKEHIATVENFFPMKGKRFHEILFIHMLEFVNEQDKLIEYTLDNIEGKDYLKYIWLDLDKIEKYNLVPKVTKEILKEAKFPTYKINID